MTLISFTKLNTKNAHDAHRNSSKVLQIIVVSMTQKRTVVKLRVKADKNRPNRRRYRHKDGRSQSRCPVSSISRGSCSRLFNLSQTNG